MLLRSRALRRSRLRASMILLLIIRMLVMQHSIKFIPLLLWLVVSTMVSLPFRRKMQIPLLLSFLS